MTFSGNFMPKRFGAGKPQKPKIKVYKKGAAWAATPSAVAGSSSKGGSK